MDLMDSFPNISSSDDDSRDLDFLSRPWPDDEDDRSASTESDEAWPDFDPKWRDHGKIIRISALPPEDRNDVATQRDAHSGIRQDDDDDDDALTLCSMASATAGLSTIERPTSTPTKSLLRQKLPMLLCNTRKIKRPSPGDKRVRFADHTEDHHRHEQVRPSPPPPNHVQDLCFSVKAESPVEAYSGKISPSNWIHNANLFEDKTLPSNTLDFFCQDSNLVGGGVPSVYKASYSSEEDTTTSSSGSSGGRDVSSLPGSAIDARLARMFFSNEKEEDAVEPRYAKEPLVRKTFRVTATRQHAGVFSERPSVQARDAQDPVGTYEPQSHKMEQVRDDKHATTSFESHKTTPLDLSDAFDVSDAKQVGALTESQSVNVVLRDDGDSTKAAFTHMPPAGSKVADRQKWLQQVFQRPEGTEKPNPKVLSNTVSGKIAKFGGRVSRPSAVQLKKEELERKVAMEQQKDKPCFKTKWEGRPGHYKKKVVLSTFQ